MSLELGTAVGYLDLDGGKFLKLLQMQLNNLVNLIQVQKPQVVQ